MGQLLLLLVSACSYLVACVVGAVNEGGVVGIEGERSTQEAVKTKQVAVKLEQTRHRSANINNRNVSSKVHVHLERVCVH